MAGFQNSAAVKTHSLQSSNIHFTCFHALLGVDFLRFGSNLRGLSHNAFRDSERIIFR